MLEESVPEHNEYDANPYVEESDDENYVPQADVGTEEASDIEQEIVIDQEEECDSDESAEDEPESQNVGGIWIAKDKTEWVSDPLPSAQTSSRNVLRQRGGPATISKLFMPKELFKLIISPEMCDIILRETNRKGKRVCNISTIM